MSTTHEENVAGLKNTLAANNAVFTTIKIQYPGSWNDDLVALGKILGITPEEIVKLNPWLNDNNFIANDSDYAVIQLKSAANAGAGGATGNNSNDVSQGYYVTNEWTMPLGVGTWHVSRAFTISSDLSKDHRAVDFTTGIRGQIAGYPIYASKAGTVVSVRKENDGTHGGGWGNSILIRHDETGDGTNCYYTRYAHMISIPTQKVGDKVSQAEKIGAVGNTGVSTGYHLHFQVYYTGKDRTDFGNFTAHADFSVDPNTIPNFPGTPFITGKRSVVNYQKCDLISENDIEQFKRAIAGTEAENPMTESEWNTFTNGVISRYLTGTGVDSSSELGKFINDFLHSQFDNIKNNGLEAVYNLMNGGDFFTTLQNFCDSVVQNAIWYVENKVGEVLVTASQTFINNAKTGLKTWIFDKTNVDPKSELGQSVGTYLDGYIDSIVNLGWSAVRTAITTGDVRTAAEVFLVQTKNTTIDYVANIMVHGATSAIKSYIPTVIQDPNIANAATSIATGVINVTIQSVGGVLKGQISIEQAAKNIISSAVITISQVVFTNIVQPVLVPYITQGLMAMISAGLEAIGLSLGSLAGPIGTLLGGLISALLSMLFNFLLQKLVGWFTQ